MFGILAWTENQNGSGKKLPTLATFVPGGQCQAVLYPYRRTADARYDVRFKCGSGALRGRLPSALSGHANHAGLLASRRSLVRTLDDWPDARQIWRYGIGKFRGTSPADRRPLCTTGNRRELCSSGGMPVAPAKPTDGKRSSGNVVRTIICGMIEAATILARLGGTRRAISSVG